MFRKNYCDNRWYVRSWVPISMNIFKYLSSPIRLYYKIKWCLLKNCSKLIDQVIFEFCLKMPLQHKKYRVTISKNCSSWSKFAYTTVKAIHILQEFHSRSKLQTQKKIELITTLKMWNWTIRGCSFILHCAVHKQEYIHCFKDHLHSIFTVKL